MSERKHDTDCDCPMCYSAEAAALRARAAELERRLAAVLRAADRVFDRHGVGSDQLWALYEVTDCQRWAARSALAHREGEG